jgi:hypothetical protein
MRDRQRHVERWRIGVVVDYTRTYPTRPIHCTVDPHESTPDEVGRMLANAGPVCVIDTGTRIEGEGMCWTGLYVQELVVGGPGATGERLAWLGLHRGG